MKKLLLKDLYFNNPAELNVVQVKMQILYLCCNLELLKCFKTEMDVTPAVATKLLVDNETLLYNPIENVPSTTQKQYSLCSLIKRITANRIQLMQEYLLPLNQPSNENTQWELYEHLGTQGYADEVAAECAVEVLRTICAEAVSFAKYDTLLKPFSDFCITMCNYLNENHKSDVAPHLVNVAASQIIALVNNTPLVDLAGAFTIKNGDYNPIEVLASYFHVFKFYQLEKMLNDARKDVADNNSSPLSVFQYKVAIQLMNNFTGM